MYRDSPEKGKARTGRNLDGNVSGKPIDRERSEGIGFSTLMPSHRRHDRRPSADHSSTR